MQTSLAMANEEGVLPVSLTFARFGIKDHVTVWGTAGKGRSASEREWHAVQFGALSMETFEKLHELCASTSARRGLRMTTKKWLRHDLPHLPRRVPTRKTACGLVTDRSQSEPPVLLFARKLHSEAWTSTSQLSSEFFWPSKTSALGAEADGSWGQPAAARRLGVGDAPGACRGLEVSPGQSTRGGTGRGARSAAAEFGAVSGRGPSNAEVVVRVVDCASAAFWGVVSLLAGGCAGAARVAF